MGSLWRWVLRYLRQEPLPPGQAELEVASLVLTSEGASAVWDADVLEIWDDGDTFTARLRQNASPDLLAEFSMRQCGIAVEPGDLLIVTPARVIKRNLGVWTQAELDEIKERAHERFETLRSIVEPEVGLGWPRD